MDLNFYNGVVLILVILMIWAPWLWRYKIKPFLSHRQLQKKLKLYPHWKQLIKTEYFLFDLYKGLNTNGISKEERTRLGIDDDAFVYGEIEFLPFYSILDKVKPK